MTASSRNARSWIRAGTLRWAVLSGMDFPCCASRISHRGRLVGNRPVETERRGSPRFDDRTLIGSKGRDRPLNYVERFPDRNRGPKLLL